MVLQNLNAVQNVLLSATKRTVRVPSSTAVTATCVPRVGVVVLVGGLRAVDGVPGTGVADKDLPCSHGMVAATIGGAGINGVTVVDTLADRVAFDDLDTHDGSGG